MQIDAEWYIQCSTFIVVPKELMSLIFFFSLSAKREKKKRPGRLAVRDCLGRNEAKLK